MLSVLIALISAAHAYVDPACADVADAGPPDDYSEQDQQDFLLNYFSLATSFSPLHAPVPQPAGRMTLGIEAAIIPPLSCERRLVLNYTKTEDTNKAPVAPRPRISFTSPRLGDKAVVYGGLGYIPPVTVFGTRNVIVSGELGVGFSDGDGGLQWGGRFHATLMKTIAEIATPFDEGGETVLDFYSGSTFGLDGMVGYRTGKWTPYAAVGVTDASTFFYIGDTGEVINNLSPFLGPAASVGAQWRATKRVQVAGEFYTAVGYVYTGRLRASFVL